VAWFSASQSRNSAAVSKYRVSTLVRSYKVAPRERRTRVGSTSPT
jgi:hypothetical protein